MNLYSSLLQLANEIEGQIITLNSEAACLEDTYYSECKGKITGLAETLDKIRALLDSTRSVNERTAANMS